MAKKAKKAKKISKSKKVKRGIAKRKETVTVPIESVVQFVKMLINEGHADEFQSLAKESKVLVSLGDDSTDFVRKFLTRNNHLRGAMARTIREPCPGNPFEC
jgi:hypothetical protein